jgi:hypothetical protein
LVETAPPFFAEPCPSAWNFLIGVQHCVSVGQSVVPNLGESERFALRTRLSKFLSTGRRGYPDTK